MLQHWVRRYCQSWWRKATVLVNFSWSVPWCSLHPSRGCTLSGKTCSLWRGILCNFHSFYYSRRAFPCKILWHATDDARLHAGRPKSVYVETQLVHSHWAPVRAGNMHYTVSSVVVIVVIFIGSPWAHDTSSYSHCAPILYVHVGPQSHKARHAVSGMHSRIIEFKGSVLQVFCLTIVSEDVLIFKTLPELPPIPKENMVSSCWLSLLHSLLCRFQVGWCLFIVLYILFSVSMLLRRGRPSQVNANKKSQ